jgi:glutaryl-CoA dehydrogenase
MREPMSLGELSGIEPLLTEEERAVRDTVRRFVAERYLPRAAELFEKEAFAQDLVPELAALGLLGGFIQGYGCAAMSSVAYGLALAELEYGDSALRSFVSVQSSLAMYAILQYGSEAQRQKWLPAMQRGEIIGCFGLTEPDSGSDPGSMKTRARSDADGYVLQGTKMWITNAPIAHLAVVWAKVDDGGPESIRGFVVERGTAGFETPTMQGKMSLRASPTGELVLTDCVVPRENALGGPSGLAGPLGCLAHARFGIAWGVLGAARACYESALHYARSRVQFDVPIGKKQLVQEKLVRMAMGIATGQILALHYGRGKDRGQLSIEQVSLCKKTNVAMALAAARDARAILGANGILLAYPAIRHMLNLETVSTYEGTDDIHTLILGRALTGLSAF